MTVLVRRLVGALIALATLVVIGTAGYMAIEGRGFGDALYMTVITVTAVGYEEVWPLTSQERAFTMVILLGGISWMGLWFATLTAFIVELDLRGVLARRRTMREIAKMKDHVVICGAGRAGRQVARELVSSNRSFVVIERDPSRVELLKEYVPEPYVVIGDATHDHVLLEAALAEAHGLIACLSADTDNLYVCLSARELAPGVTIVARAYEEESVDKLHRAGADHVVSPNVSSAVRMASLVQDSAIESFVDIAGRASELALRMEQVGVLSGSVIEGQTLGEAQLPKETGLIVIAVGKHGDHGVEFVFNPSASTRIDAGDELVVLGRSDQIDTLKRFLG